MSLTWASMSRGINSLMTERDREWCGMPMPLPGLRLEIEDRNPWIGRIRELQAIVDEQESRPDQAAAGCTVVNTWYSRSLRCHVGIARDENGTLFAARYDPDASVKVNIALHTIHAATAWNLAAESAALDRLYALIRPHLFEAYCFTGAFLETSARSGVTYLFRRCRPTLAIRADDQGSRFLCALCLHPIGFYAESFAGSMVPTDEVIAHLLLMRGDEPLFWRRANQHAAYRPEAAV